MRRFCALFLTSALLACPAFANTQVIVTTQPSSGAVFGATIPLNASCSGGNISVCGQNVAVPAGTLGSIVNLAVPSPYIHQPFSTQCVVFNGIPTYQITSPITCTLMTCAPSNLQICGIDIPVSVTTPINKATQVTIPRTILGKTSSYKNVSFAARCADNGANAAYEVANPSEVSCNIFPCADSAVRLCESEIAIPGGAPLGTLIHMTMPEPFAPEPFDVQCVGTNGQAPSYQVTDHSAVHCAMKK